MEIILPTRHYVGVPSSGACGLVTEPWALPVARTALIELHCWNVGVPGGIPVPEDFWVFMGSQRTHERMAAIVENAIAPTLAAGRRAGMPVVHIQSDQICSRYPKFRPNWTAPKQPQVAGPARRRGRPGNHPVLRAETVHGAGYRNWEGWRDLDIAPQVAPEPGDVLIAATEEFDDWLAEREIDTLLYTGFCTNLCILDSLAAMRAMANLGYRCVIVREATLGCEFDDQPPTMHTEAAIRYIESWIGYSTGLVELQQALAAAHTE